MLRRHRLAALACAGALAVTLSSAAVGAERAKPEFLNPPEAATRGFPFSEAVRAGDFLFLSGMIGFDPGTDKVVPGGIKPEARKTLSLVQEALKRNGASLADVVKCTVFLADIAEWPAFNEVYVEFFKKPFPARSALAASGLARNARVEVECIAYVPK
ncbi:MAG TPA: Rid family detoxifying hydrolase [Steroidobacteraceae bacterium]|nr:Rid family detoxifying hydrolase [Steroidobacteraceae bacterium]